MSERPARKYDPRTKERFVECPDCSGVGCKPCSSCDATGWTKPECDLKGHSWFVVNQDGVGPIRILCEQCGIDGGLVRPRPDDSPDENVAKWLEYAMRHIHDGGQVGRLASIVATVCDPDVFFVRHVADRRPEAEQEAR